MQNKDNILIIFDLEKNGEYGDYYCRIIKYNNGAVFPIGLTNDNNELLKWLKNRILPKNRKYSNEILHSFGLYRSDIKDIIIISKLLSLNDSYWILKEDEAIKYKYLNLYDNNFNKELNLIAFTGQINTCYYNLSPELTTGGTLAKTWVKEADGIYLYKGCSHFGNEIGKEAFIEFYASQIAYTMELDYVNYDLIMLHNELTNKCLLFSDINTDYVPFSSLRETELLDIAAICKKISNHTYEKFADLIIFDSLIYNLDRHLGNFGLLRNNNTGQFVDLAPIFDNGISLFNQYEFNKLFTLTNEEFNKKRKKLFPRIGGSFNQNAYLFLGAKQKKKLLKMRGFKFKRHPKYNLEEERLIRIEQILQERLNELLNIEKIYKQEKIEQQAIKESTMKELDYEYNHLRKH